MSGVGMNDVGPFLLLADQEEKKRLKGDEAQKANILAAIQVASTLRTSFGPRGMDKIIISPDGDVTVTNDGATILKKMPVTHECARLLVELSQSQDDEIGDGTTGVVILAGALLQQALKLLDKKIHPLKISDGFEDAAKIAVARITAAAVPISQIADKPEAILRKIARTALCSKVVSAHADQLADICVQAIMAVADIERKDVNFELIKIDGRAGGKVEDTRLIDGIVLQKDFSHSQMRKEINDAKIAILTTPFEPPKPKTKHKLSIKTPEAYKELMEKEQEYFRTMVDSVKSTGADVVLCQWGFDDEANHLLYKSGLSAVRWVGGQEIELLSLATGGQIISRFEDLTKGRVVVADPGTAATVSSTESSTTGVRLGYAKKVAEICVGTENDRMIVIEGCGGGRSVTIFVRGSNSMVISEAKRCLHDALCCIRNVIRDNRIVGGGGSSEVLAGMAVLEASREITNVTRHSYEAFSSALFNVTEALCENSGEDPIKILSMLKKAQAEKSKQGATEFLGINCMTHKIEDMLDQHIYETLSSKVHQINLATQAAKLVLKIDDIIQ